MGDDTDDNEQENLPVPRNAERVERLKKQAELLDDDRRREAVIPTEARDIGEVEEDPNPRAGDLDYPEDAETSVARNFAGVSIMYDGGSDRKIECDPDTFIEDVSQHN